MRPSATSSPGHWLRAAAGTVDVLALPACPLQLQTENPSLEQETVGAPAGTQGMWVGHQQHLHMLQLSGEGLFSFVFSGRLKVIVLFQEGRPKDRRNPAVHGQISKMWSFCTMEYYSALKREGHSDTCSNMNEL